MQRPLLSQRNCFGAHDGSKERIMLKNSNLEISFLKKTCNATQGTCLKVYQQLHAFNLFKVYATAIKKPVN